MAKKFIIFFLLFNYLNASVFFPETNALWMSVTIPEDEINSLLELMTDKCFGMQDNTPEDEDDDIPDSGKSGEITDKIELHTLATISLPIYYPPALANDYSSFNELMKLDSFLYSFSPPPEEMICFIN